MRVSKRQLRKIIREEANKLRRRSRGLPRRRSRLIREVAEESFQGYAVPVPDLKDYKYDLELARDGIEEVMLAAPGLLEDDFDDFIEQAAVTLEDDLQKSAALWVFAKWFYSGSMEADLRKMARAVARGSTNPDLLYTVFIVALQSMGDVAEDGFLNAAEEAAEMGLRVDEM